MLFLLSSCFLSTLLLIILSILIWKLGCNLFLSWFILAKVDSKQHLLHVLIPLCVFKLLVYSIKYLYKFISSMSISYEVFRTWHFGKGAQWYVSFMIMQNLGNVQRHLFFYPVCQANSSSHLSFLNIFNHFSVNYLICGVVYSCQGKK